ncbi:MAG: hypothetical protein GZ094_00765 [Mariniphaga sp.]|nr:hypothetical protein [Mariniphaga sp.]
MSKGFITFFALLLMGSIRPDEKGRMFIDAPFRPDAAAKTTKVLINFMDSVPDDTLTIYFSATSQPEAFSRNIYTAVCIDSLCRPVDITLYWEVTGKYIGYSLPPGEELTKREHVPFLESDYKRLSEILSDSTSQLGFYSPEEIHPKKQVVKKSDGITGATLPDLSPWIVPEAAYTSYTIWHLTYGVTRDSIMNYTKKHLLSNQLLTNTLQNMDPYNQIIALRWISESDMDNRQFIEPAITMLHSENYQSSRQALKFLKHCSLIDKEHLQIEVIKLLESEEFRIKNLAIEYIRESEKLTRPVAQELMKLINNDNYYLVNVILLLLEKRYNFDYEDQLKLCTLLDSKNENVANRVYYFLLNLPVQSSDLKKQLNRYQKKIQ